MAPFRRVVARSRLGQRGHDVSLVYRRRHASRSRMSLSTDRARTKDTRTPTAITGSTKGPTSVPDAAKARADIATTANVTAVLARVDQSKRSMKIPKTTPAATTAGTCQKPGTVQARLTTRTKGSAAAATPGSPSGGLSTVVLEIRRMNARPVGRMPTCSRHRRRLLLARRPMDTMVRPRLDRSPPHRPERSWLRACAIVPRLRRGPGRPTIELVRATWLEARRTDPRETTRVLDTSSDPSPPGRGGCRIRCPRCAWEPGRDSRWQCECLYSWNTFDTGGLCPACGKRWETTQCLRCKAWSPHRAWYAEDEPDAPRHGAP